MTDPVDPDTLTPDVPADDHAEDDDAALVPPGDDDA